MAVDSVAGDSCGALHARRRRRRFVATVDGPRGALDARDRSGWFGTVAGGTGAEVPHDLVGDPVGLPLLRIVDGSDPQPRLDPRRARSSSPRLAVVATAVVPDRSLWARRTLPVRSVRRGTRRRRGAAQSRDDRVGELGVGGPVVWCARLGA
jgi:hypothetical protein